MNIFLEKILFMMRENVYLVKTANLKNSNVEFELSDKKLAFIKPKKKKIKRIKSDCIKDKILPRFFHDENETPENTTKDRAMVLMDSRGGMRGGRGFNRGGFNRGGYGRGGMMGMGGAMGNDYGPGASGGAQVSMKRSSVDLREYRIQQMKKNQEVDSDIEEVPMDKDDKRGEPSKLTRSGSKKKGKVDADEVAKTLSRLVKEMSKEKEVKEPAKEKGKDGNDKEDKGEGEVPKV